MAGPQPLAPAPMADQQPQWKCAECGLLNWPSRRKCRECRQRHTPGARGPATASPPRNHRRRDGGRDDDAAAGRRQQQGGRGRANSSPPKLRGGGAAPPESPSGQSQTDRKVAALRDALDSLQKAQAADATVQPLRDELKRLEDEIASARPIGQRLDAARAALRRAETKHATAQTALDAAQQRVDAAAKQRSEKVAHMLKLEEEFRKAGDAEAPQARAAELAAAAEAAIRQPGNGYSLAALEAAIARFRQSGGPPSRTESPPVTPSAPSARSHAPARAGETDSADTGLLLRSPTNSQITEPGSDPLAAATAGLALMDVEGPEPQATPDAGKRRRQEGGGASWS